LFVNLPREALLFAVLLIVVAATGIDLVYDLSHGSTLQHVLKEASVVFISTLAIVWILREMRHQARQLSALKEEIETAARQQPDAYVLEARRQLAGVIGQQFTDWRLTDSEREVGWLLLKGLSLKEIAAVRNTLEKTVRQQASSIYKKAGLTGRHAFSAWFIEDLL